MSDTSSEHEQGYRQRSWLHQLEMIPTNPPAASEIPDECPVCREPFNEDPVEGPVQINLPDCRHVFGHLCLQTHVSAGRPWSQRCPICRAIWLGRPDPTELLGDLLQPMDAADPQRMWDFVSHVVTHMRDDHFLQFVETGDADLSRDTQILPGMSEDDPRNIGLGNEDRPHDGTLYVDTLDILEDHISRSVSRDSDTELRRNGFDDRNDELLWRGVDDRDDERSKDSLESQEHWFWGCDAWDDDDWRI